MGRKLKLQCKNCQHTYQVKMGSGEGKAILGYYRCLDCAHLWPKTTELTSKNLPADTITELKLLNPKIEIEPVMTPERLDTISEILTKEGYTLTDRLNFWKCKIKLEDGVTIEGLDHALDYYMKNLEKIVSRVNEPGVGSETREYFQDEIAKSKRELEKEESLIQLIKSLLKLQDNLTCLNCSSKKITRWIPSICPKCGGPTRKRLVHSWH